MKKGQRRGHQASAASAGGPRRGAEQASPIKLLAGERGFFVAAAVIVAVTLALRLYRLGAQELWFDEVLSFEKATRPDWLGLPALKENTPPLYYLLLRAAVLLLGPGEFSLRLLSAFLGGLFVAAVIWAGREIFDGRVGLWAGACAALNPIHIYYSQEARAYALLMLALLLSYVTLWRALARDTWRDWLLFSASALLALYSHYSAVLGLAAGASLLLFRPGAGMSRLWLRYGQAVALALLLFVPWSLAKLWFLTARSSPEMAWVETLWEQTSPWLAIPTTLEVFAMGSQAGLLPIVLKQYTYLEFPVVLRVLGLALHLLAGIWIASPVADGRLGLPWLGRRKAWLGVLLLLPLAVLWVASFYRPVYLAGRYDLVAFPAYPLLLGLGLAKLHAAARPGLPWALVAGALLFLPVVAKLVLYYQAPPAGQTRATAELLAARVGAGDAVVFTGPRSLQILHYLRRLGYRTEGDLCADRERRFSCRQFPGKRGRGSAGADGGLPGAREEVQDLLAGLRPSGGVLWVIFDRGGFVKGEGRFILPEPEASLVRELERAGWDAVPVPGPPGIFQFRPR